MYVYLDDDELSSGNTLLQSSQLAEPVWTDFGLRSGISVRNLISTFKKKAQAANELWNILPKFSHARKAITTIFCLPSCLDRLCKFDEHGFYI